MANPQTENGYIKVANELWDEVIRRDFSKRQKDILFFIWRFSYGFNKKTAYIPKLVYFELCGVGNNHIKQELQYLEQCRVIIWDREERTFEVNKDYETWQVSPVKGWLEFRFDELQHLNLQKSSQNGNKKVPETGTKKFPKQEHSEDGENEKFPKQELWGSQNGNIFDEKVPETGTSTLDEALQDAGFQPPKDIFKDSIKDSSSTSKEEHRAINETAAAADTKGPPDYSFKTLFRLYENHFTENGKVTEFEVQDLGHLFDDHGGEWLYEGMKECARNRKMYLSYLRGVMQGFAERGGPHVPKDKPPPQGGSPPSRGVSDAEETRREIAEREALQRRVAEDRQRRQLATADP